MKWFEGTAVNAGGDTAQVVVNFAAVWHDFETKQAKVLVHFTVDGNFRVQYTQLDNIEVPDERALAKQVVEATLTSEGYTSITWQ